MKELISLSPHRSFKNFKIISKDFCSMNNNVLFINSRLLFCTKRVLGSSRVRYINKAIRESEQIKL